MAVHLENLNIESFRGIFDLVLEDLNHVNIIVGDNNSGKTSVLEALMFLRNPRDFNNILRITRIREMNVRHLYVTSSLFENFINLFPRNVDDLRITINGKCRGETVSVELLGKQSMELLSPDELFQHLNSVARRERMKQYPDGLETSVFKGKLCLSLEGVHEEKVIDFHTHGRSVGSNFGKASHLNVVYLSPFEHMGGNIFDKIVRDDQYKVICINVLRLFDPKISDLLYLKDEISDRPIECIKHETLGNMPISTYGDGIKKVLSLANGIAQAENGTLMIDELETAIHAKYYDDIFRFIIKACKQFQVQLFITTHSMEAIDKLLATQEYDNQDADDITVITFKKEPNNAQTLSRTLSGRRVYTNRDEFGFEVRL